MREDSSPKVVGRVPNILLLFKFNEFNEANWPTEVEIDPNKDELDFKIEIILFVVAFNQINCRVVVMQARFK